MTDTAMEHRLRLLHPINLGDMRRGGRKLVR